MRIKKYEAINIETALHQVKNDLGPDALILQTQKVKKRPPLSLFKKEFVEVTAALDPNNRKSQKPDKSDAITLFEQKFKLLQKQLSDVGSMVNNIKTQLNSSEMQKLPESLTKLYNYLVADAEVENIIAEKLLFEVHESLNSEEAADEEKLQEEFKKLLISKLNISGQIAIKNGERKVVILVGPTGVGKTTTLAKLAAYFSLVEKRKIALLTADTYRIAAVDQLKTYAEIINIPLEVAITPEECKAALAAHADKEIVLIDTAGRSPYNSEQIKELKSIIKASTPCDIHLVLSAATTIVETMKAINAFGEDNISSLLFTKLDETSTLGRLVSILIKTNIPLSYVTNGQNVPQDITVYDAARLAEMILSNREERETIAS